MKGTLRSLINKLMKGNLNMFSRIWNGATQAREIIHERALY